MSQFQETHQPCEECGSSDARATYHSGVSICFSCGDIRSPSGDSTPEGKPEFIYGDTQAIRARRLDYETCARYGYQVAEHHGKAVQVAPYYDSKTGKLVAQKVRDRHKNFHITGDAKRMGLFGIQLARRNGKMVVITEGEIDAMSVSQAMGNTWPALSLPNGASNLSALKESLEFLETYEKVVLAFDNDEAGQKATAAALELFSPGKAFTLNLGDYKDANDMLLQAGEKALRTAVWEAREYRPDGIVDLADMREEISAPLQMGTPYPWEGLNRLTFGWRPGELITWTAGTGTGKTAIISELEYHVLMAVKQRLGIIHLEEGCVRSGRRLVGIHMKKPIHLPGVEYTQEAFDAAFEATLGTGRAFAYNHFGSLDDDILLNRIRYLARAKGCDTIFLDHVSMVVSGADLGADERRMLDRIVTRVKSLAEETGVTIHMVSHLSRPPGTASHEEGAQVSLRHLRGSQSIAQLSDFVIALERNQQAESEAERNTTRVRVLKNRYAGLTGPACSLAYSHNTGRVIVADIAPAVVMGGEDF